jgi:hypothetical protein
MISGWHPPAAAMPKGTPGMNIVTKSHVEAHAAAVMRNEGLTEATLWINRSPCGGVTGCAAMLPRMVPRGSTLTIHVVPNGSAGSVAENLIIRGGGLTVLARYQPPGSDSPSQFDVSSGEQLDELLARAADHFGDRGIPAVELTSDDGSTLVMGQTRRGAVLLWIDAQGEAQRRIGQYRRHGFLRLLRLLHRGACRVRCFIRNGPCRGPCIRQWREPGGRVRTGFGPGLT